MIFSYSKIRAGLFSKRTGYLILALLAAFLNCPNYTLVYAPGIDGSLPWVYNYFADGHYELGKNVIFPHGPLAFLIYPLVMGNNLFVASAVFVFCAITLALTWYKIVSIKTHPHFLISCLLLFAFLAFADIQLLLVAIVASHLWLFRKSHHYLNVLVALIFCVFNLFIKSYGGVICVLLVGSEVFYHMVFGKNIRVGVTAFSAFLLLFYVGWFILYGSVSGSLTFLIGQFQLSFDNSEAVQFDTELNWWLISACLISLITLFTYHWLKDENKFLLVFILPLFAAWKHGMARSEEIHMTGFFCFLVMLAILTSVLHSYKVSVFLLIAAIFFVFAIPFNDDRTMEMRLKTMWRAPNLFNNLFKQDTIGKISQAQSSYYCRYLHLPDSILKLIGRHKVDVYPWNYAIIATNQLNWQPRPIINSYAAYTSWLDQQDASHWDSDKAPEYVIWELTDIDQRGMDLESIDQRYLLNDEPQAVVRFFANYKAHYRDGKFIIYKKLRSPDKVLIENLHTVKTTFNQWCKLPSTGQGKVLRVKLKFSKKLIGVLKSLFYKGELFKIHYATNNNQNLFHRIIPKNSVNGIWLSPLILHPGKPGDSKITKIKITCQNPNMVANDIILDFEKISFYDTSTVDVNGLLFSTPSL